MAMADGYGLFWNSNSGDRKYDAQSFEKWLKKFFTSGVFEGDLQVLASSGMTVQVQTGYSNVNGKVGLFESATNVTLNAANSRYPRIDTIIIERNDVNRVIQIDKVTGAYTGENPQPTAPIWDEAQGIYQLVLAQIYVGAGVSSISQEDITDKRTDTDVCGYITGTVNEMDFSQFTAQFEAYFSTFEATQLAEFETWFEHMKDQLDEDAAGHLQAEVDDLNNNKAPTSHSSEDTTYGIGTATKYGHCKTINALTQSSHADGTALSAYQGKVLNDKIKTAQDILDKLTARVILFDNKEAHIRHDITSRISDLPAAIASGHPEAYGFYEGDYFNGPSGYVYILADFDHWYGAYDSYATVSTRHWGVLVDTKLTTKWNDSSTDGGYVGSTLHSLLTGTVLTNVKSDMAALGLSLITNHRLYSNMVTTTAWNRFGGTASGASTTWDWYAGQIISAPTEAEMYGHIAFSSSGYDTGEGFKPLAVCQKYRPNELFVNRVIWLRDVASASYACILRDTGIAGYYTVSYAWAAVGLIGIY